jgi:hypothetical protein
LPLDFRTLGLFNHRPAYLRSDCILSAIKHVIQRVISWRGQLLVYEPVGQGWRAQWLGTETHLEMTAELLEAIDAEEERLAEKGS